MQQVNIYIYTDITAPGTRPAGTYIYRLRMAAGVGEKTAGETLHEITGQRLQLMALTAALKCFTRRCRLRIFMDSPYVSGALERGCPQKWQAAGWRTSRGTPVANKEAWAALIPVLTGHEWEFYPLEERDRNELKEVCIKYGTKN